MSKLILLWFVILLGIFWLAFPYDPNPDNWIEFFPCSNQKLPWQNYIFHASEKLIFVIFAWIIYSDSDKYKIALLVFFGVQVLRLFDYFITYNNVWVRIWPTVPFSSNTLGILVFSLAIAYEWIWKKN